MTITNTTRKRRLTIFHLYLPTHRTEPILWILQLHAHLIHRSSNPILNNSNSIHRIRTTLRTNIILRCNSNYKPPISNSLCRERSRTMSMRWVRSRQRHINTILRTTLLNTIRDRSNGSNPPTIPSPNRIK
jgi:hypothetical protein